MYTYAVDMDFPDSDCTREYDADNDLEKVTFPFLEQNTEISTS